MNERMLYQIAEEVAVDLRQVRETVKLLDEGNTVPFIARYRKEMTGQLDEEHLRLIEEKMRYLRQLEDRKEEVVRLIDEQGKLTDALKARVYEAKKLQTVEDLYRPYRQKRRTRATKAKEKGLEPLAEKVMQAETPLDIDTLASPYISEEKGVSTKDEALQGALDIIAETVADDPQDRQWIREKTHTQGMLRTERKNEEETARKVYEMYYEYAEPVKKMVPHRVLAMNRGESENILKVRVDPPTERIETYLHDKWVRGNGLSDLMQKAVEDGYKRLIAPAVEREVRNTLTETAEEQAIHIFAENLRNLLLQPPVKGKTILGVDPAYRTGCKLAVIDATGQLLQTDVIYPTPPLKRVEKARETILEWLRQYQVDIVAIGNGTASRETERFVAETIQHADREVFFIIVNEAGASVYSASPIAKEEFPHLDVSERSAVSIARRLSDPLAELVKIDPRSVGVGQYQHDVSQKRLSESLTHVVESAVNYVGVDANTASVSLLQYVSGISKTVAQNIVARRKEVGSFTNRGQIKDVPRLGPKTYEQCIGFLRIVDGDNPLDQTPIHPESYKPVAELLQRLDIEPKQIGSDECRGKLKGVSIHETAEALGIGEPTLHDIIDSLLRPGRDPREALPKPVLQSDVLSIEDLEKGMPLQGTVRNVVDFGAFVDIGLKNDGLVHISQLSTKYVKHPMEVTAVGDIINVWVLDVDRQRERVGLTMVEANA